MWLKMLTCYINTHADGEDFCNKYTPPFTFQAVRVILKRSPPGWKPENFPISSLSVCVPSTPSPSPRLCYSSALLTEDESIAQINVCTFLFLWGLNKEHTFVLLL